MDVFIRMLPSSYITGYIYLCWGQVEYIPEYEFRNSPVLFVNLFKTYIEMPSS